MLQPHDAKKNVKVCGWLPCLNVLLRGYVDISRSPDRDGRDGAEGQTRHGSEGEHDGWG